MIPSFQLIGNTIWAVLYSSVGDELVVEPVAPAATVEVALYIAYTEWERRCAAQGRRAAA